MLEKWRIRLGVTAICLGLCLTASLPSLAQEFSVKTAPHNLIAESQGQTVMFNVETHKFHNPTCRWALRCTQNCIAIPRAEALRRGGIPCKVCGGR